LAAAQAMEREEPIEDRCALGVRREAERRRSGGLEPADLAAELMPLLLAERLDVDLVVTGKIEDRRHRVARARHAVARVAEDASHHLERRTLLGHVLEPHAGRSL